MEAHSPRLTIRSAATLGVLAALSLGAGCAREGAKGPARVSGNIEATEVQVSFKVAGRVVERSVDEGQGVKAGQPIARLDDTEFRQEVARQQAQVDAASAQLKELSAGYRTEEVAQAEAALDAATAEADRAGADLARQEALLNREVISRREYEASKSAADASRARVNQASENLALLRSGFRREKVEAARAALKQMEAGLDLARTRLSETRAISPLEGTVLSKAVEPGEFVSPGTPVVTVADLSRVWLRAYVDETDLGRLKLGQAVRVTADTFPGKAYSGRIAYISPAAEFTPKTVQTRKERVRLVYRIKVDLDNPAGELKPGMPADAQIGT
jgi:HlyD family secretion protein